MRDLIGRTLGHYRIVEKVGAGGMGVVYRAHDDRLDRDVAIKVLPEAVAENAERLARFEREAKLLASLSHQNIATLYGVEEDEGRRLLVMELAEGETLAARINRGPIPIEDVLDWARQIAEGLEAAHSNGIIHRDLKPANVMLSPEGSIKILDFGLAKALQPETGDVDFNESPTLTAQMTAKGVLVGTAAYMSPEQARGKRADKRADNWAFGCVLYEMLTGSKAFEGDDASQTMAAILRDDPDWDALPPATPAHIRRLLGRCLVKKPHDRLHDIADARIELASIPGDIDSQRVSGTNSRIGRSSTSWFLLALVAVLGPLALLGLWSLVDRKDPPPVIRSQMSVKPADWLGSDPGFGATSETFRLSHTSLALSPDGLSLVFSGGIETNSRLYLRTLDDASARPIEGTEGAVGPFFSPDGQWIGFWAGRSLKKVRTNGGSATAICSFRSRPSGVFWGGDGTIYLGQKNGPILQVASEGGETVKATVLSEGETSHRHPHLLPDGDTLLFTTDGGADAESHARRIVAKSLESGGRKIVVENGADGRYSSTGHLLFCRLGHLLAVPFDLERLKVTGGAEVVLESVRQAVNASHVNYDTFSAQYAVSSSGTLAYIPGGVWADAERSIVWVDREGREESLPIPPGPIVNVRVSPDGKRIAYVSSGFKGGEVWVYEIARGTLTRITHHPGEDLWALWTPGGSRITFSSVRSSKRFRMYWVPVDGTGSPELFADAESGIAASWSPDGQTLAFLQGNDSGSFDVWMLQPGKQSTPFIESAHKMGWPSFSPSGEWLAYSSFESGQAEVYVTPYPGPGSRIQISNDSGLEPSWSPDGGQLYYLTPAFEEGTISMWAVDVTEKPRFEPGRPRLLFEGPYLNFTPLRGYDVSPDGRRFLMITKNQRPHVPVTHIEMVFNWFTELERLVPTD